MTWFEIASRFMAAMAVGAVIGIDRERAQRAAGFRTHFLVAVGAAVAMLTGEYIAAAYASDPSRIAAQVISGVGFLGAGTILKEGASIRGLTTAASLWATACLGIAAGAGFYIGAGLGLAACIIALTLLERVERNMSRSKRAFAIFELTGKGCAENILGAVRSIIAAAQFELRGVSLHTDADTGVATLELRVGALGVRSAADFAELCGRMASADGIVSAGYRLA